MQSVLAPAALAAEVLGRAFESDPMFTYLLPRPQARARVTAAFFGVVTRYSQAHGVLDVAPEGCGAACWLRPGHTAPAALRLLQLNLAQGPLWRALVTLGVTGLRRLATLATFAGEQHRRVAPDRHWYLWALGVQPDCQRQGVGGRLLQAGLARADEARLPCYLEANNVLNVIFYQKYGFKVVSRSQPAGHELTFWAMSRDPQ